jgi:ADP-heptose:LPS heptosyltransferase
LRTFFKKILFAILNKLFFLIKKKPQLDIDNVSDIVILIQKPLGIGDLTMLSPLVVLLEETFKQHKIYIITEYEKYINFERVLWVHPANINKSLINKKSLVISPMLTFSHFKYLFQSKYFIGYFFSNRLVSNFNKNDYFYSLENEHYLKKIFPIFDALNIQYDKEYLSYPKIMIDTEESGSDHIVIAPYVNWEERQFPQSRFVDLINNLLEVSTSKIVLIGSGNPTEVKFNKQIEVLVANSRVENQTGLTTLMNMTKLINNAKLFIGNDSGPSHIAYLSARKSLVFFGSVRFEDRIPLNSKLTKNIYCIDSRTHCPYFPCYDGLSKPNCMNTNKYSCISYAEVSNQLLKELLK